MNDTSTSEGSLRQTTRGHCWEEQPLKVFSVQLGLGSASAQEGFREGTPQSRADTQSLEGGHGGQGPGFGLEMQHPCACTSPGLGRAPREQGHHGG